MSKRLLACCAALVLLSPGPLSAAVADLQLTLGVSSPSSVSLGSPLTYTLMVNNAGPDAASDVVLTELLPAVVNLVSAQSDFGACTQSANTITCHLDSLASGGVATLSLVVIPTSAGLICNFAKVIGSQTDPDYANNRASLCTTVTPLTSGSDLSVSLVSIPDSVPVGGSLTYSIRVRNNGRQVATGVRLLVPLPTNTTFVSASPDCAFNDGVVSCTIPKLGKNASVTRTIVITPGATGLLCNRASVLATEPDPRLDNNTNEACTLVTAAAEPVADLAVVKITAPPTVTLTAKKPALKKLVSVQIQNRSPHNETISRLDNLVTLNVESLGLCSNLVPVLRSGPPQKRLPITLKPKQNLNLYFELTFDTNSVNDPLKNQKGDSGHADYRYVAAVHHEAIDGQPDTHPGDDTGPRSVLPPFELAPNPDGKLQDRGVGQLKSDHTFGADIFTDVLAPAASSPPSPPPATNRRPVAVDDRATTTGTAPVQIPVLLNDSDPDGDSLAVIDFTQPANGVVNFTNNLATYVASPGFLGSNTFQYTIGDGHGSTAIGHVAVTVSASANHPPIAVDDTATTSGTNAVHISVLANDSDPDGDTLVVTVFSQPANGTVNFINNLATYTANLGFVGTNTFQYTVGDGRGASATGHVAVTVSAPPNRPPIAVDDTAITSGTTPVLIPVLANDSDPDGDPLAVTSFTQPANGVVTFLTNVATFTANAGFAGTNFFQYTISDGRGASATGHVSVTVTNPPPPIWETSEIGAVWSDDFNRAALGPNWILSGANAGITNNEVRFSETSLNLSRQAYYNPWQTCSDHWTIRWRQRFGALDANSFGVGVGIKNFQAQGGNDRGYNGLLRGDGANSGKMQIQRFDGSQQILVASASGPAMTLAAGQVVDCSLTRSGWTITATASNRANAQVSTTSLEFSDAANLIAPTISRMCFYPLRGTIYVDDVSFTIDHRKPARFIVVGASISDGYNASDYPHTYASIIQSNFTQTVCNDSSSWNSTTNSVAVLPEILAHQPGTAILMIGGNDVGYGYPAAQWQSQYSNLVAQLQANGVTVKHCLNTPRNTVDLRPLNNWITNNYPAQDIIDTWTPLLQGDYLLNPAYDSIPPDGVHPNNAGHLLMGQTISSKLQ